MDNYSAHWRLTILAAVILHLVTAWALSCALPKPEPTIEVATPFDWVDVELSDEVIADAEIVSTPQETSPTFRAQDLFVPELPIPDLPTVTELPLPETKPVERPQLQPPPVTQKPPAQPKPDNPPPNETPDEERTVAQPPVTLKEVYPERGAELDFRGYVAIAATVGTDGKVHDTEIIQTSGRYFVDEIARKAASQWTFKPALDQHGKPIECYKIITFDFKRLSEP